MIAPQDRRLVERLGLALPIVQAPMAGASTPAMAAAVSQAGGLGSLPAATYDLAGLEAAIGEVRAATDRPFGVNFFCHTPPTPDPEAQARWAKRLAPYYGEARLEAPEAPAGAARSPFDAAFCALVERLRPPVVSFHFGLPEPDLLARVRASGAFVIGCATTVEEAVWLGRGVDAVIAQGAEAGGHRGSFLTGDMSTQLGLIALLPQVVDAVDAPVIAAGGIADPRGVAAAFALGAAAAQVGTAYLLTPEARISQAYRSALLGPQARETAITNLFTGRPARGIVNRLMREIGPISADAPAFPTAGAALAPLRAAAEAAGRTDFTNLWAGQAAPLARPMSAAQLTDWLAGGED